MASHPFRFLLFLLTVLLSGARVRAVCYYPDGSIAPNDTPCQDLTAESTCCGQGYACLSNSMCQATGKELSKDGATELVRGSCTDRSWRSSRCPLFCINPETDNVAGGIGVARITNCNHNDRRGSDPNSIVVDNIRVNDIFLGRDYTDFCQPSYTAKPELRSTKQCIEPEATDDRTVIIGAAVGASVGGLALGVLAAWLFILLRRRKRRAREEGVNNQARGQDSTPGPPPARYVSPPVFDQIYEAPNEWKPPLVSDHFAPQELPGCEPEPRRGRVI
ncbi:hypothetical protein CORC01_00484 [Colletotrichum orchidophilum]|uniref:Mid2 domain-containing protein n=1 Tax=Colletotrichum orchidophilum TaxID=1209926 RepID=A0A1G4BS50_9PEZI|nr:uncharacterized protein CORC01_00484 [Colletotrichum orchidophilum]OHF04145.1 hypothetical protein CORC01_00484 [Colletotrichum orchidophilum]